MESSLKIGASPDQEGVAMVTASIIQILQTGYDLRVSETLMEQSLNLLHSAFKVDGVTVQNCNFVGTDNTVSVQQEQDK